MNQYKVTTTLTDGTQIESGTIIIPQGSQGPQGPQGPSFRISGIVSSTTDLPPATSDNLNIGYLVGTSSPYTLYTNVNQQWVNTAVVEGATIVTCNDQTVGTFDLTNITFRPRYESTGTTTITKTVDEYSGEHSIKWEPISVTGMNVLGNWIEGASSLIELAMGDSNDIVLGSQQFSNDLGESGEYLVWNFSDAARAKIYRYFNSVVYSYNNEYLTFSYMGPTDMGTTTDITAIAQDLSKIQVNSINTMIPAYGMYNSKQVVGVFSGSSNTDINIVFTDGTTEVMSSSGTITCTTHI